MKPKKYTLETNEHGNLDSQPVGWITFEEAGISKRSRHHRAALESGRIYLYEVLLGFDGGRSDGRYGWRPILEPGIHRDQMPLFDRLASRSRESAAKTAKAKSRKRAKLLKTPEYQRDMEERRQAREAAKQAREKRRIEGEKKEQVLSDLCEAVGIPPDEAGRLLAEGLKDIKEAHPSWLSDAYEAVLDGERYGGIMKKYLHGALDQLHPSDRWYFYDDLRIAIRAHRRHHYTNYEELLEKGYTREEALVMKS